MFEAAVVQNRSKDWRISRILRSVPRGHAPAHVSRRSVDSCPIRLGVS